MTPEANRPAPTDPTDPEVRDEIIGTVRRFVANEVVPVASALEHEDRFPDRDRRPDARLSACSG